MLSEISRLGLGSVQFGMSYGVANTGGQVSPEQVADILRIARAAGVNTLDTAAVYGDAESRLGNIGVTDWRVVSKLPPLPDDVDPELWVRLVVKQSLSRLRIPKLYGLLLHQPLDLCGSQGDKLCRAMSAVQHEGLVTKIGVSVYGPDDLEAIWGRIAIGIVQSPLNLVDRRLVTSGWLSRLKEVGVEVHVRSVFLQGLLLMGQQDRPRKFDSWHDLWERWERWLTEHRVSPQAACLSYPLAHTQVDCVIFGVDNSLQLSQILAATKSFDAKTLPDLSCDDEHLLNPSKWNLLEV